MSTPDKCPTCDGSGITDGALGFNGQGPCPKCADKCPHCGADSPKFSPPGFYLCGSSVGVVLHQSELCRERTAHGKPTDEPNPNGSTNARLNWWKQRCDALSDELTREREKWEKLREWAEAFVDLAPVINKMIRLDAEAKEGR